MKAVVIGGGIIGLSSAYFLHKRGWDIIVIDKIDLVGNCSHGNLGMIPALILKLLILHVLIEQILKSKRGVNANGAKRIMNEF